MHRTDFVFVELGSGEIGSYNYATHIRACSTNSSHSRSSKGGLKIPRGTRPEQEF